MAFDTNVAAGLYAATDTSKDIPSYLYAADSHHTSDAIDGVLYRVNWSDIQPTPSTYNWGAVVAPSLPSAGFDVNVGHLVANHKKVSLAVIAGGATPGWIFDAYSDGVTTVAGHLSSAQLGVANPFTNTADTNGKVIQIAAGDGTYSSGGFVAPLTQITAPTFGTINWVSATTVAVTVTSGPALTARTGVRFRVIGRAGTYAQPIAVTLAVGTGTGSLRPYVLPLPWDTTYLTYLQSMITTLAAHLSAQGWLSSVSIVKPCGANEYTEEVRVPAFTLAGTGWNISNGPGILNGTSTDDWGQTLITGDYSGGVAGSGTWATVGNTYTTKRMIESFRTICGYWNTSFPAAALSAAVITASFPDINNNSVALLTSPPGGAPAVAANFAKLTMNPAVIADGIATWGAQFFIGSTALTSLLGAGSCGRVAWIDTAGTASVWYQSNEGDWGNPYCTGGVAAGCFTDTSGFYGKIWVTNFHRGSDLATDTVDPTGTPGGTYMAGTGGFAEMVGNGLATTAATAGLPRMLMLEIFSRAAVGYPVGAAAAHLALTPTPPPVFIIANLAF